MNRLLICAALAAITVVAQGCQSAGGTWTKAGADPATVNRDMEECRKVALFRANPPVAPSGSPNARTDIARPGGASAGSNERFVNEQEEVRRCMLGRGYVLQSTP